MSERVPNLIYQHDDLSNPSFVLGAAFCLLWAKSRANSHLESQGRYRSAKDFWRFTQLMIPFLHQATGESLESLVSRGAEQDDLSYEIANLIEPKNLAASEVRILHHLSVLPDDLAQLMRFVLESANGDNAESLAGFWKWRRNTARDIRDVLTQSEIFLRVEPMMVEMLRELLPRTSPVRIHGTDAFLEPWLGNLRGETLVSDYACVNLLSIAQETTTGTFGNFELVDLQERAGYAPHLGWLYGEQHVASDKTGDSDTTRGHRLFLDSVNLRTAALLFAQSANRDVYGPILSSYLERLESNYGSDVTARAETIQGWDRKWVIKHLIGRMESESEMRAVMESTIRRPPSGSGLIHPTMAGMRYYELTRALHGDLWALMNCSSEDNSEMLELVRIQKLIAIGAIEPWQYGARFETRLNHHVFTARALLERDPTAFLQQLLQRIQEGFWTTDEEEEWLEYLVDIQIRTLLDVRRMVAKAN